MASFSINQLIRWHSQMSIKCSLISPQSNIKLNWLILLGCINHLFEDFLQLLIINFHLPVSLRIIQSSNFMLNSIFSQKYLKLLIIKVRSLITYYSSWCAKPHKYVFAQEFYHNSCIIDWKGYSLHLFWHIIYYNQNILVWVEGWKQFQVVNPPNIKQFHF